MAKWKGESGVGSDRDLCDYRDMKKVEVEFQPTLFDADEYIVHELKNKL